MEGKMRKAVILILASTVYICMIDGSFAQNRTAEHFIDKVEILKGGAADRILDRERHEPTSASGARPPAGMEPIPKSSADSK
jgi:hypothetical protein